jgi:hypothetical protein
MKKFRHNKNMVLQKGFTVIFVATIFFLSMYVQIGIFDFSPMKTESILLQQDHGIAALGDSLWWNSNWLYRKLVTINHSKVSSTLINFPILISFSSDTNLAAHAQHNGADICFINYDDHTKKLNHEIELYTYSTGKLVAWVNITRLISSSDTKIWMYYGNSQCGSQQNIVGTWNSHYISVYHMNDVTTSTIKDSTHHHENGTKVGSNEPIQLTGKIGYAQDFGGYNDKITIPSGGFDFTRNNKITAEFWMKPDTINPVNKEEILHQGLHIAPSLNVRFYVLNNKIYYSQGIGASARTISATTTSGWRYIVGSYDGSNQCLYEQAILMVSNPVTGGLYHETNPSYPMRFGCKDGDKYFLNGSIDEIRFSDIAWNQSWITTSLKTMINPSTFIKSIGNEENNPPQQYSLTIHIVGSGSVTKNPDQSMYNPGQIVTLTAVPVSCWNFDHWSGHLNGNANPTTITMNGNKDVTATFTPFIRNSRGHTWPAVGSNIQVALDDLNGAGEVWLPGVTFNINSNLGISKSGTKLHGAGNSTLLVFHDSRLICSKNPFTSNDDLRFSSGLNNIQLDNFKFTGDGQIEMTLGNNTKIFNVVATDTTCDRPGAFRFVIQEGRKYANKLELTNCHTYKTYWHGYFINALVRGCKIENVSFIRCTARYAGWPYPAHNRWSVGFHFCELYWNYEHNTMTIKNVLVKNCVAEYNWESGFHFEIRPNKINVTLDHCLAQYNGQKWHYYNESYNYMSGYCGLLKDITLYHCVANYNNHYGFLNSTSHEYPRAVFIGCTGVGNRDGLFH